MQMSPNLVSGSKFIYPPFSPDSPDTEVFFQSPEPSIQNKISKAGKSYKAFHYPVKEVGSSVISELVLSEYDRDTIRQIAASRPGPQDLVRFTYRSYIKKDGSQGGGAVMILPQHTHPSYPEEQKPLPQVPNYNKPHVHSSTPVLPATASHTHTSPLAITEKQAAITAGMILKIVVDSSTIEMATLRVKNSKPGERLDAHATIMDKARLLTKLHIDMVKVVQEVYNTPGVPQYHTTEPAPLPQEPSPTTEMNEFFEKQPQAGEPIDVNDIPF